MTALARARIGSLWKIFRTLNAKLAAGAVVYKGAACGFKGGYLVPWADNDPEITHPCLAIPDIDSNDLATSTQVVDNSDGIDGALSCPVDFGRELCCYLFANDNDAPITQGQIGGDAWGLDDQTVTAAPGTRSRIGTPWVIQGANQMGFRTGVYVELDGESGGTGELPGVSGLFVRNVILSNLASLAAYTVAASAAVNDNVLNVERDVVALVAQSTAAQNGLYRVGEVASGVAPLTRISSMPAGAVLPNGITFEVQEGGFYGGKTWKSMSTQSGGWKVGTHDPKFYPRTYSQTVTLAAGTYTIGVGSTATPDEPLFLWTTHNVQLTQNTHAGTAGTNKQEAPSASRVTGLPGTAKIVINSLVDAGTVAGSDSATVDVLITNG